MTRKIIIVDIGTHRAQEFGALFIVRHLPFFIRVLRHRIGCFLRREEFLLSVENIKRYLSAQKELKNHRADFFYIMVEPNPHLFQLPIYTQSDAAFNIALSNDAAVSSIVPLYLVNGDLFGQGSSLFTEKPNVDTGKSLMVLNLDVEHFARQLKASFDIQFSGDYALALRINNEGAESDAIMAFEKVFADKFRLVLGSLKDVIAVKGEQEMKNLEDFMQHKEIQFIPFHSRVSTWEPAARALLSVMNQKALG